MLEQVPEAAFYMGEILMAHRAQPNVHLHAQGPSHAIVVRPRMRIYVYMSLVMRMSDA